MSWAEDNNMDVYDPELHDPSWRWSNGYHITKDGKEIKLIEMTESHLKNTIKYFSEYDTTPLEDELKRRTK